MMRVVPAILLLTLVAAALPAHGQTNPDSAPASLGNLPNQGASAFSFDDAQAVIQLEQQLASASFATRDEAQRSLSRITVDQLEPLRALARAAADPEVQARLSARVADLELQKLMVPPPITVHLKEATLADIAAALTSATGRSITSQIPRLQGAAANPVPAGNPAPLAGDLFTLDAVDLPFWEIEKQLCAQHAIWFMSTTNRLARDDFGWREQIATAGTVVCIEDLRRLNVGRGAAAAPAPALARFSCGMGIGVDPRVHVTEVRAPDLNPVIDNLGQTWPATISPTVTKTTAQQFFWTRAVTLQAPAEAGNTLRSVRGSTTLMVEVPGQSETRPVEIPFEFKNLPVPP